MVDSRIDETRTSYNRVADEYVRRIYNELESKPFDRQLLSAFAERLKEAGLICDLGCGPGHIAQFLHECGAQVCGIDLSPEMVDRASSLNPGLDFKQGDMLALEEEDETWAGIVAYYSIIHTPRSQIMTAMREMWDVLKPGGLLLIAFHIGDEVIHLDEWWGYEVSVDFHFFRTDEITGYLKSAGFEIEEMSEREPYPDIEAQTRRAYILARKQLEPAQQTYQ